METEDSIVCRSLILSPLMKEFLCGNEDKQKSAARQLLAFVSNRFQDCTQDTVVSLLRELDNLLNSPKYEEKRGGIYAAVVLLRLEVSPSQKLHIHARIKNAFQSLLVQEEPLQILISRAIGYISRSESRSASTIGYQFWHIAIDWLSTKGQIDVKRIASLLIIKELAINAPSYYHYKLEDFYDISFSCIIDNKPIIREIAISALKACLRHTATKEVDSSTSPPWKSLYKNAQDSLDNVNPKDRFLRDDRTHCYILVVTELLRISALPSQMDTFAPFYSSDINLDFLGNDYVQSPTYSYTTLLESLHVSYRSNIMHAHPYSERCKSFISKSYSSICSVVFKTFSNKSLILSAAIINILPWLALFDPQTFALNHIQQATDYLILLTNDKDRASESFNALGLLILALRDSIKLPKTFLKSTIDAVWSKISPETTKKYREIDPAVYNCISYLLRSKITGLDSYKKLLIEQLENMSIRLSSGLIQVLKDITETDLKLKKSIQQHLLQYLFLILVHKPIHHPGIQRGTSSLELHYTPGQTANNISEIVLSLKTLSDFEFNDLMGIAFYLKIIATTFLKHSEKKIRIQTIETCCNLLEQTIPSPILASSMLIPAPNQQAATQNVSEILNLLLKVGVTDQDKSVRLCVFCALSTKFDGHLAQAENLEKLFAAFQDEFFKIKLQVLCILGRLNVYNPAYLLPSLRKTLVQLLDDLRLTNISHLQEQSAQLLACLITHTPVLVKPYFEPILDSLIPKLTQPTIPIGVLMSVLQAIAMQAKVSQSDMKSYSANIILILRDSIHDASSISTDKTLLTLWAIGELLEHTHYVLDSKDERPQMMNILYNFLKVEVDQSIRLQCIRVLGLLGALDPQKYLAFHLRKDIQNIGDDGKFSTGSMEVHENTTGNITSEIWVSTSSGLLEDFYPQVAIKCLLRILNDSSLSAMHPEAAMSLPIILEYLGDKAPHYIKLILPTILPVIELNSDSKIKTTLFSQLKKIIAISGPQAKDYMSKIFELIKKSWNSEVNQKVLIELIKQLITTLGSEFRNFLPQLVQQILEVLLEDNSLGKQSTIEILKALQACGPNIDDFLHMLLPPVIELLEKNDSTIEVIREALDAIKNLSSCIDFNDFVSPIVHALVRTIESKEEVRSEALEVLINIIPELGRSFEIFIPLVNAVFERFGIFSPKYNFLIQQIAEEKQTWSIKHSNEVNFLQHALSEIENKNLYSPQHKTTLNLKDSYMNVLSLSKAWNTNDNVGVEAWTEWLRRLSLQLVQETPDKAIRALSQICTSYNILAREIFNATFVSCWSNLPLSNKANLITSLEKALQSSKCPEIVQIILNLVEFIEHLEDIITIPLDNVLLCDCAYQSRAYTKALRYKEKEFKHKSISKELLESLIDLNNKLQVPEASFGVLEHSKKNQGIVEDAKWYESLQCWDQALDIYRNYQYMGNESIHVTIGKLRCLDALGEWEELYDCTLDNWTKASQQNKRIISQIACSAAWGLNKWEKLNDFIELIPSYSYNGAFYRAVMAIHSEDFDVSRKYIQQARELLDPELSVLVGDSYTRAYNAMVLVQNLSELEEVIDLKIDSSPSKFNDMVETWWNRLQGCNYNVDDWQKILLVRSLVVKPSQDTRSWIKYASLCKKSKRIRRARETLINLGADQIENEGIDPNVEYAFIKFKWNIVPEFEGSSNKQRILEDMFKFTKRLLAIENSKATGTYLNNSKLLAKCFLHLGIWNWDLCKTLQDPTSTTTVSNILAYLKSSTEYNSVSYKAWHAWAIFNFELGNQLIVIDANSSFSNLQNSSLNPSHISSNNFEYVKNAIDGFLKSISLSKNSLQDSLRLLTLWFTHAGRDDIFETLAQGIRTVSIDTWLQVIPQLIARIDSPIQNVRKLIHNLLVDLSREHPQALVFPITVASKSNIINRAEAARAVLNIVSDTKYELALQAILVSEELIRVAILWHEQWHEGLEEASRLYFADKNVVGMLNVLEPLHAMLEHGPQTLNEMSFSQAYGRDLSDAQDWCKKYQSTQSIKDLTQAWELYFHVFKRISKQLPLLVTLELKSVSNKLFEQRDMVLPVPGTYQPGNEIIYVQEFSRTLQVIPSKQRPRKLSLRGSNGKDFQFLLKGHEDLRQDARVMQLFGLVNTLLLNDTETFKKELFIQRYSVIPLSPNSGLIGWVPNCDTMHALIRDFRDRRSVVLNIEHRLMLKYSPDYECLPLLQKVEVFERALDERNGEDLSNIMWLKSPSSEVWFTRRTKYTRSLAVMSMVGYILGLGDRHPSNLMIDRFSGRVLHIDFGDCFEVAMTREKFPEKIPFRLTRMLVKAMEVTGIDGTFKHTCINVMGVLRHSRDSVMAVLEAFVYDPLISWRLVDTSNQKGNLSKKAPTTIPTLTSDQQGKDEINLLPKKPLNIFNQISVFEDNTDIPKVELNEKALEIKSRIKDKLYGFDFSCQIGLSVEEQVQLLINQATSHENLCQCYIGWCPFW